MPPCTTLDLRLFVVSLWQNQQVGQEKNHQCDNF
jgi:hypothetical protein